MINNFRLNIIWRKILINELAVSFVCIFFPLWEFSQVVPQTRPPYLAPSSAQMPIWDPKTEAPHLQVTQLSVGHRPVVCRIQIPIDLAFSGLYYAIGNLYFKIEFEWGSVTWADKTRSRIQLMDRHLPNLPMVSSLRIEQSLCQNKYFY